MLYKMIEDPQDGDEVQYLAVYALRWRPEWGAPQYAFVEATEEEIAEEATDGQP